MVIVTHLQTDRPIPYLLSIFGEKNTFKTLTIAIKFAYFSINCYRNFLFINTDLQRLTEFKVKHLTGFNRILCVLFC